MLKPFTVLGCGTYKLDYVYGSETTEGYQMGLLARERDYLQMILSVFLTKAENVANTSFGVFLC